MRKPSERGNETVLGHHPAPPSFFGEVLYASDGVTISDVPYRALLEVDGMRSRNTDGVRRMVQEHHASEEAIRQTHNLREAMRRLGMPLDTRLMRFPTNPNTRKGNLAEIVLAEYVAESARLSVPVYRLRYNPNVNQSMKGDDVLAFDFESQPVRVLVGEAKFRTVPSRSAVEETVEALARSHRGGVPVSLQFVADRLFEQGEADLGSRVMNCALLLAQDRLRLDYVGLILSDDRAAQYVRSDTPAPTHRLAMISLGIQDPEAFVCECYFGLE